MDGGAAPDGGSALTEDTAPARIRPVSTPSSTAPPSAIPRPALDGARADLRNLGLIVAGWGLLLVGVSPAHDYPVIDDWIYAGSVQHQLATGAFEMHPVSQANLVGLTLWGTAWARVLGFSYTTLTWSTLALALGGLLAFYGLLREVAVPPGGALLGTALLAGNPLFLHLSYSFMTDVPFLALVLGACYAYARGLRRDSTGWLAAGGLLSGGAFLIRQFGMLVPLGFGAALLLDALLTRRLRGRALLITAGVPLLIVAGWWLWSREMPPTPFTVAANARRATFVGRPIWMTLIGLRALALLPLTAFAAWGPLRLDGGRRGLPGLWGALLAAGWLFAGAQTETLIGTTGPPAPVVWGPLRLIPPEQIYPFTGFGNLLRTDGIDFFGYQQAALGPPELWTALCVLGTILGAGLLAALSASLGAWIAGLRRRVLTVPLTGVYLVGLAIGGVSLAFLAELYDRYLVGFLPFVILFVVRGAAHWSRRAWSYALVALFLVATSGVLLQADAVDHDNARWQAATWLVARGGLVHMGYDWDSIYATGDGSYTVADGHVAGYSELARFPYLSRLTGFTTRYVIAQGRFSP